MIKGSETLKVLLKQIYDVVVDEREQSLDVSKSLEKKAVKLPDDNYLAFISVDDNNSRALVVNGRGKTVERAISSAVENYKAYKPEEYKPVSVKLDIVSQIKPILRRNKTINLFKDKLKYNRGIEGIAFGENFHTAFLPQEITGYHMIESGKLNIKRAFKALHNHLPTTFSQFTVPIDERIPTEGYRFKTKAYFINEDSFVELYRGHKMFEELTERDLETAIQLTKDNYFKNVVNNRGKFIYSFLPHVNKREKRYNILRHAGTVYSMLEIFEIMPDEKLMEEAKRAFKFLFNRIKPLNVNGKEVKVVVEKDAQKIGGNALAIIALAKYTQITNDKQYVGLMQDLAAWMREVQAENGEFTVHKQRYSTGERFDFISHYYPGEAILSLVRLYQIDGNEEWLDVAEKAAHFLINIRDKDDSIDTIAHDHWLLYGLNELYRERQKDLYLKHSFFIAEAMMKRQITKKDGKRKELIGGYVPKSGNEPRSTPVACRSEGLGAAYRLAKDHGHDEIATRMRNAIEMGIKFQLQMQLRPESVMYYKRKKLCLGAVQSGLKGFALRIDYTQHNISSFISFLDILKSESKRN